MEAERLTEDQLEEILKTLTDERTDTSKLMEEILSVPDEEDPDKFKHTPENIEDNEFPYNVINKELGSTTSYINVDTNGNESISDVKYDDKSITKLIEDKEMDEESSVDTLKSFGLSDEDSAKLFNTITRYMNKEKFNIYNELPTSIQEMVKQLNGPNMGKINATTKDVLNYIISNIKMDKEFVDLQESISKELQLLDVSDMYSDELKDNMEVKLLEKADILEKDGELEKANSLRKVSAAFTDSYKFNTITSSLNEDSSIRKKIRKDLSRFKRIANDFEFKYRDSKFKITSIKLLKDIIPEIMSKDGVTVDDAKKFVIVICKTAKDMTPDNIEEHVFMYYTIQNIILLKFMDREESEFAKEVYSNLLNIINLMKEVESNECNFSR